MEKHYFKTAEFAALCGVKKDTLLHYDHIGLLKPQWVGENGYRYYAAQQLRTYDLIAVLRRLGTPLAEIRDYLTRRSPQALLELLEEKGYQVGNVDATILAQKPKLAPYIEKMRDNLAARMKVEPDQVNVKATTEEKLGFTGAEEGIAAHAVALLSLKRK